MRVLILSLLVCSLAGGQAPPATLTFAPQRASKNLEKWAVVGSHLKQAVGIGDIYAIADAHHLTYLLPDQADQVLRHRTKKGIAIEAVSVLGLIGGVILIDRRIQAKPAWAEGAADIGASASLFKVFLGNPPGADSRAGKDLSIDLNGSGMTMFYTLPAATVGGFTEVVK